MQTYKKNTIDQYLKMFYASDFAYEKKNISNLLCSLGETKQNKKQRKADFKDLRPAGFSNRN